ncbi:MAG: glycoside hydrolase family 57 protein [Rhodocyclaceae bacterium]
MAAQSKLDLVLVWHMHQPDYRDRVSRDHPGEYMLPWVYLHAMKDYADMAAHLERHPRMRAVVNFVPVLVEQIQDYIEQFAGGNFRDPLLRLLAKPDYANLSREERRLALESCFHANHPTMLDPFPGYKRLHGLYLHLAAQETSALDYLGSAFFEDLVTWYHLAWFAESERRREPVLAQMFAKGRGFDHQDRLRLVELIGGLLKNLLPRFRTLAESGRIELSATPYSHPLAPLLIDLKSGRDAVPEMSLPATEAYPGGRSRTANQIERARTVHTKTFGSPPHGMWPAEGALSTALLQIFANQGIQWAASSEAVLANSLRRAGDGKLPPRAQYLYRPYRLAAAPGVTTFFRDERLSDLIGFEYAKWHGRDAAGHFLAQLEAIRNEAPAGETPLVCVILDGENAWEYYPYNGYFFFDALYSALSDSPSIRVTTFNEYLGRHPQHYGTLPALVTGSWVYGTLSTWVGDPDKNRAWDLLCAAKQSYDLVMAGSTLSAEARHAAEQQLAVCESSDWFWWFGDYNPQTAVASFDRLFRLNLRRLYELLNLPPPAKLEEPLSRGTAASQAAAAGTMRRAS